MGTELIVICQGCGAVSDTTDPTMCSSCQFWADISNFLGPTKRVARGHPLTTPHPSKMPPFLTTPHPSGALGSGAQHKAGASVNCQAAR